MTVLDARPFGRTGLQAAPLGLAGSWGIDADSVVRGFHELGINYFFVTTTRSAGLCEGIRRLVADGHREQLVIAGGASIPFGWSVGRELRKTAKLVGVERVDVFHLFWVQAHWYVTGNTWKEMRKLKEEGHARALAVSIHDRPMARRLVDELELDALMIRYNAAHRGAEREIFASLAAERRPAIVAYTATRWGKLLEPAGALGPMSGPECYRFALGHPFVDVVLCGPRTYAELEANARGVALGPLDDARAAEVREFGDAVRSTATGGLGWRGA